MLFGSRDALRSLEQTLSTVGGDNSLFLRRLHFRMAMMQLPVANTQLLSSPSSVEEDERQNQNIDQFNVMSPSVGLLQLDDTRSS